MKAPEESSVCNTPPFPAAPIASPGSAMLPATVYPAAFLFRRATETPAGSMRTAQTSSTDFLQRSRRAWMRMIPLAPLNTNQNLIDKTNRPKSPPRNVERGMSISAALPADCLNGPPVNCPPGSPQPPASPSIRHCFHWCRPNRPPPLPAPQRMKPESGKPPPDLSEHFDVATAFSSPPIRLRNIRRFCPVCSPLLRKMVRIFYRAMYPRRTHYQVKSEFIGR